MEMFTLFEDDPQVASCWVRVLKYRATSSAWQPRRRCYEVLVSGKDRVCLGTLTQGSPPQTARALLAGA